MTFDGVLAILVAFDLVDETEAHDVYERLRNNRVPDDLAGWLRLLRPALEGRRRQAAYAALRDAVLADGQVAA